MMKSDMRSRDFARGSDIGGPPSMSVNKFGNTYGLSTVFLESLGITGPLVNKVFVANVSAQVHYSLFLSDPKFKMISCYLFLHA